MTANVQTHRRLGWIVAVVSLLAALVSAGISAGDAGRVGPRVSIAVYGDSVVEGYTIPHYLRDGLIPQLRRGLAAAGPFEDRGIGFVPFTPFRWTFNRKYTVADKEPIQPEAWALSGAASGTSSGAGKPGVDGLSGFSGFATSPEAAASAPIDAPYVAILFTKFDGSGVFTVTAGSQTFTIDARSSGPPTPTEQWITVPSDAKTITVHGPSSGTLIFNGIIVRGRPSQGHIGIEVENLGHRGHRTSEDSAPRILEAVRQQRFDISVFLDSYLWEFQGAYMHHFVADYAANLRSRVDLVRGYGGLCLIADPGPLPLPPRITDQFAAIDKQVAHEKGCAYSKRLTQLWDASKAIKRGLTLIDGIHPAAPGYALMAKALIPDLVKLVRERVRLRGF